MRRRRGEREGDLGVGVCCTHIFNRSAGLCSVLEAANLAIPCAVSVMALSLGNPLKNEVRMM